MAPAPADVVAGTWATEPWSREGSGVRVGVTRATRLPRGL